MEKLSKEVQVFKLSDIEILRNKLRYFLKVPSYKFFEKKWSDS